MELKSLLSPSVILCALLISSCVSIGASKPLVYNGGSNTEGSSNPLSLSGESLLRIAGQLGVSEDKLRSRKSWWYVVGPLQRTGGWSWHLHFPIGAIEPTLCLMKPPEGASVTMGFSAPSILIGIDSDLAPRVSGLCL